MVEVFMVSKRKEEKKDENPSKKSLANGRGGGKMLAHIPAVTQEI